MTCIAQKLISLNISTAHSVKIAIDTHSPV